MFTKKITCNEDLLTMLSKYSGKVICLHCKKEYTTKYLDTILLNRRESHCHKSTAKVHFIYV